jgi:peptidoglycan hydrolase-like protein with peptidoglycan-binding domain
MTSMNPPPRTLLFVDAAYAGAIDGGPFDGVCFYLPGGDAYHPWPLADLEHRPERYRLPVWVRSTPENANPGLDGITCLSQLAAYWVPMGSLVALDSETSIDPPWVRAFVSTLNRGGYPVIDYGSESTVFANGNPDGYYWAADWNDLRHLAAGSDITQYANYPNQDLDAASPGLPFWDTKPFPVTSTWTEFDMARLPVLRQGAADKPGGGFWYVHRLQALINITSALQGISPGLMAVDGLYGPATAAAVRDVQTAYHIAPDGVAGPKTWSVLLTGSPGA